MFMLELYQNKATQSPILLFFYSPSFSNNLLFLLKLHAPGFLARNPKRDLTRREFRELKYSIAIHSYWDYKKLTI